MIAMELENQVCQLDLAKRLKELGVKQESYWKWDEFGHLLDIYYEEKNPGVPFVSAFTVAELGEMLPKDIDTYKTDKGTFWCHDPITEGMFFEEKTEADARAKMLIYLLENKVISLPPEK